MHIRGIAAFGISVNVSRRKTPVSLVAERLPAGFAVALAVGSSLLGGCADPEALAAATGGGINAPPLAAFTTSCSALTCDVDGRGSVDTDGGISDYAWNFGDGAIAGGATSTHRYAAAGTYTISLTVTDSSGATAVASQDVLVSPGAGGNNPPTASFSVNCTNSNCAFDASASSDSDGNVVSYAWDFGDGSTAVGVTASHSFVTAGSYAVRLTVTDNQAATSSTSQTVTVSGGGSLDGKTLYDQNCASCHGADATGGNLARISIVGANAVDIELAIDSVPNMSSLKSMPAEQIQAIANYLASLVVGTTLGQLSNTWSEIVLMDAAGTTVTVSSDPNTGTFIVDGSALDGAILASAYFPTDGSVLYGYASSAGVLNVTPVTTEVLQLASGGTLNESCSSKGCFIPVSQESLRLAEAWVALELADAFSSYGVDGTAGWMNQAFDFGTDSGMAALISNLYDGGL